NYVCSTGAPIWALEWCPLPSDTSSDQVVAVAVDSLDIPTDSNKAVAGRGVVQFWSLRDVKQEDSLTSNADQCSAPDVSLWCCLAHDAGRVRSLAWCPENLSEQNQNKRLDSCLPRLGILALACSNGTVQVFSVPQLDSLLAAHSEQSSSFSSSSMVLMVKPKASLSLELNSRPTYCGQCLALAWQQGGHFRYIAAGYSTGMVVIWDLQNTSPLLSRSDSIMRPLRSFQLHGSSVISLAWCPQLPDLLASSSMDFTVCLTDVGRPAAIHADKRQIQPSVFRSLRWAGPLYFGLLCGEESLSVSSECGMQYLGLCHMGLGRKMDSEFLIHNNTATTW
ncbi:general transcription factor 3C polypeptide 2, partial [Elysia marginata]